MLVLLAVLVAIAALIALAAWYSLVFPLQPYAGPLPALSAAESEIAQNCRTHIEAIASRPHNVAHYADLDAAARYIEVTLAGYGYSPTAQIYDCNGTSVRNIELVIEPSKPSAETASFIVGGHYDSPDEAPGANDNGTGVAGALELARLLRDVKPATHRLRIVFWVNEERPYGKTPLMGSWQHAKRLKDSGERVAGMIALETIGYFTGDPGTQNFPPPFGLVYPDTGNFIAFVGLPGSRSFLRTALQTFRGHTAFPSIGGVAPGFLKGIDLSDHWAYHQFGFPSLMVTDTAPFRNPYYHELDDLPGNVDYDSLARVTKGLERMLREMVT